MRLINSFIRGITLENFKLKMIQQNTSTDLKSIDYTRGLGLWCLMPFSTIFQLYYGSQFWWRKPENLEKTTDLPQVTDKLYHIMLYQVFHCLNRIWTPNVNGARWLISNYHTIMTMTVPWLYKSRKMYMEWF